MNKFTLAVYQKWDPILHGFSSNEELNYLSDKFIIILFIPFTVSNRTTNIFNLINIEEINEEYLNEQNNEEIYEIALNNQLKFGIVEVLNWNEYTLCIPKNFIIKFFILKWINYHKRKMKYFKSIKYLYKRSIGSRVLKEYHNFIKN